MAALLAVAVLVAPLAVDAALNRTGPAAVKFVAVGNRGVRVVGRTDVLWVSDTRAGITLMVPLGTLKTGTALRDRHMRERYLQVSRHPTVRLDVPMAAVQRPPPGGSVTAAAAGTLQLHGRTQPVRFTYTAREEGGVITVDGAFRIDLRDFGIAPPSFLGIHLKPQVDARAVFQVSESR